MKLQSKLLMLFDTFFCKFFITDVKDILRGGTTSISHRLPSSISFSICSKDDTASSERPSTVGPSTLCSRTFRLRLLKMRDFHWFFSTFSGRSFKDSGWCSCRGFDKVICRVKKPVLAHFQIALAANISPTQIKCSGSWIFRIIDDSQNSWVFKTSLKICCKKDQRSAHFFGSSRSLTRSL